jgi:hypothetical protein
MLNIEEQNYVDDHGLKRLTFSFTQDDLYLSRKHGAVTIRMAMELDVIHSKYWKKIRNDCPKVKLEMDMPHEMHINNERCIEKYGCSVYR